MRRSGTGDPERLKQAGVSDGIEFATKPALAAGMLTRALHAGVPARWVAGDEVYGADPALRAECELARISYVLAIGRDRRIPTAAGPIRADTLAAEQPRWAWQRPGRTPFIENHLRVGQKRPSLGLLVGVEDAQGDHLRQLAAVLVLVVVPDRRGLWLLPRCR